MFSNVPNLSVRGGNFLNVQGDYKTYSNYHHKMREIVEARKEHALKQLFEHIFPGAFHNSEERHDPPKCHSQTRQAVLAAMLEWVRNPSPINLMMWLHGPAGAGKSAIMQTFAETCADAGIIVASFFISRAGEICTVSKYLIPTLAYQLSSMVPEFFDHVARAIIHDPAIFSRNLAAQMKVLIIGPMTAAISQNPGLSQWIYLLLVDGLDECPREESQREVLEVLRKSAVHPFRFLIASRPEHAIRESFAPLTSSNLVQVISLDDRYLPNNDIELFLREKFQKIKECHPAGPSIPPTWPSNEDILTLTHNASGQFIYAATLMKFLESPRHNPITWLRAILQDQNLSVKQPNTPFAELDALYHQIFSCTADCEKVLDILHCVAHLGRWPISLEVMETILGYSPGDAAVSLCDMHSVLELRRTESGNTALHFHHASLGDFLSNPTRSTYLHIEPERSRNRILSALITRHNVVMQHLKETSPTPWAMFWRMFVFICKGVKLTPDLMSIMSKFHLCEEIPLFEFDIDVGEQDSENIDSKKNTAHLFFVNLNEYYEWLFDEDINDREPREHRVLYDTCVNALDVWLSNALRFHNPAFQNPLISLIFASEISTKSITEVLHHTHGSKRGYWAGIDSAGPGIVSVLRHITREPHRHTYQVLRNLFIDPVNFLLRFYLKLPPWMPNFFFCNKIILWSELVSKYLAVGIPGAELATIVEGLQCRFPVDMIDVGWPFMEDCVIHQCPDESLCLRYREHEAVVRLKRHLYDIAVSTLHFLQRCHMIIEPHPYTTRHTICFSCQSTQAFIDDGEWGNYFEFWEPEFDLDEDLAHRISSQVPLRLATRRSDQHVPIAQSSA